MQHVDISLPVLVRLSLSRFWRISGRIALHDVAKGCPKARCVLPRAKSKTQNVTVAISKTMKLHPLSVPKPLAQKQYCFLMIGSCVAWMTDDFPQAVMLVSQNATTCVMVVLPMFNADKSHGMSPMFIQLRSSVGKSVSAAQVTSDCATNASARRCILVVNTASFFV